VHGRRLPAAPARAGGNTADPLTLSSQIDKLKQRFRLQRVVMVGDRGLLTSARIEQTLRPAGLDWITALRAPAIKQLAAEGGPLQPSLFDHRDMAEITSPDYPGERLVVCKNPLLAEERARKRAELLAVTEKELARIAARVQRARSPLRGAAAIGQAVGAVLGRRHMAKHFHISNRRGYVQLRPKPPQHRRRGRARRHLCDPHQSAGRTIRCPHGTSPWADGPRDSTRLQDRR
jgi:hypothetical protein